MYELIPATIHKRSEDGLNEYHFLLLGKKFCLNNTGSYTSLLIVTNDRLDFAPNCYFIVPKIIDDYKCAV